MPFNKAVPVTPTVTATGPTGSPEGVVPPMGIPDDLIKQAMGRLDALEGNLPLSTRIIIHDAVVQAYQRGVSENQAESDLIHEAVDVVSASQQDRTVSLVISAVMLALGLPKLLINLDGVAFTLLDHELKSTFDHETGFIEYTLTPKEVIEP